MSEPTVSPLLDPKTKGVEANALLSLSEEEYSSVTRERGLHLTAAELRFLRPFFRLYEKRVMREDELLLLDAIAEGNHALADRLAIATLYLNDEREKETYKDLLAKHAVLHRRSVGAPPTLAALSSALQRILARAGKTSPKGALCLSDPFAVLSAVSRGYTGNEILLLADSLPVSRIFCEYGAPILAEDEKSSPDDAVILLSNPDFPLLSATQYTDYPFLSALEGFASSPIYRKQVHAVRTVDYRGILYALSTLSDGIYTELRALPTAEGDTPSLSLLSTFGHGDILISVDRDVADEVVSAAEEAGISAVRIARAISGGRITVRVENGTPYSCPSSLIRGLGEFSPSLTVTAPEGHTEAPVYSDLYTTVPPSDGDFSLPTVLQDGLGYTAFGLTAHDFLSAVRQTVSAVLRSTLHGVAPSSAYVTLTYPTEVNAASIGRVLATLLGLYRAFAELGVPMQVSFVRSALEGCTVILRGSVTGKVKSSLLTAPDHPVYLLYPRADEDGFPDFADLRALLSAVRRQDAICNILAGTVNDALPLSSAVVSMCGVAGMQYTEDLPAGFLAATPPAPYMLVESAAPIPEMRPIGRVGAYIRSDGDDKSV